MTFPEMVESKYLLWGRICAVDNVPEEKEYSANCMKYKFHLKGGLHNSLNFPSYFGMECAALEYGQEIARIIYGNITRIYSKYHMIIYGNAICWWFGT